MKAEKKNSKVSAHPSFLNKYSNYGMDKSPMLNKSALGGVGDTTFVLNSSDIHSEENRENDPTLKPINMWSITSMNTLITLLIIIMLLTILFI